jgi:hypothetical protein
MPEREEQDRDRSHPLEQVTGERDVPPEQDRTRQDDDRPSSTDEEGSD